MQSTVLLFSDIFKFNPYHDSLGRFASGGNATSFTYKPGASTAHTKAIEREKAKHTDTETKGFKGTLYHGSPNKDIKEFDMSRAGQNTSSGEKLLFFTDSKQMADDFSYERLDGSSKYMQRRGEKGRVYEVDVEMKNPLDFRKLSDKDIDNILKLDSEGLLTKQEIKRYAESNHQLLKAGLTLTADSLKGLGYDGLIANTGKAGHNSLEYAVVDSKQATIRKSNTFSDVLKFNPYHDRLGRFTFANTATSFTYKPGKSKAHDNAIAREKERNDVKEHINGSKVRLTMQEAIQRTMDSNVDYKPYKRGQITKLEAGQLYKAVKNENVKVLPETVNMLYNHTKDHLSYAGMRYSQDSNFYDSVERMTKALLGNDYETAQWFINHIENDHIERATKKSPYYKYKATKNDIAELTDTIMGELIGDYSRKMNVKTEYPNEFQITKADDDKRLVFGWALVAKRSDGEQIIDHQGDIVEMEDLEESAYEYVLNFRDSGEEHIGTLRKKARMVESVVFTEEKLQAMGIPLGTVPYGWWIGFYVDDDNAWELIKNGTYQMFSIEGKAIREPVEDSVTKALRNYEEFPEYGMWLEENLDATIDEQKEAKAYYDKKKKSEVAKSFSEIIKFNPYHDRLGRFASAGSATSFTYSPGKSKAHDNAIAREKERVASMEKPKQPKAMTEQEYLDSKGVGSPMSGYTVDKLRGNRELRTQRGKKRFENEVLRANEEHQKKREQARAEYAEKIKNGELRDKTPIERTLDKAQGHDDNPSVQAARRMLTKRGIDWRTGKPLENKEITKSFAELMKFNPYHDRLGRFTSGGGFGVSSSLYTGDPKTKAVTFSANPHTRAGALAIARHGGVVPTAYGDDYAPPKKVEKPKPKKPKVEKPKTEPPKEEPKKIESDFKPAKNKKEAIQYAKTELGFDSVSYGTKLDLETINHINKQVADIQVNYPEVKGAVQQLKTTTSKRVYAQVATDSFGGMSLEIGSHIYGRGMAQLEKEYQKDVNSGFHPKGTNAKDIIWHEYGHVISGIHSKEKVGIAANEKISSFDKRMEFVNQRRTGGWEKEVYKQATGKEYSGSGAKDFASKISKYATSNAKELFAEAFAEFNGSENPSSECIALMKAAGIF